MSHNEGIDSERCEKPTCLLVIRKKTVFGSAFPLIVISNEYHPCYFIMDHDLPIQELDSSGSAIEISSRLA